MMDDMLETNEDLSITLLERRKRLHVLATEINNWENESSKNPNYMDSMSTPPQSGSVPLAPSMSFDLFNRSSTSNSFYSPKNHHITHVNKSPLIPKVHSSPSNKENQSSPAKRKLTETGSTGSLSKNEILNVAHRILNKQQSNSQVSTTKTSGSNIAEEQVVTGSVKQMKSKFESAAADTTDNSLVMTPRSIIKKFEQMSRDGLSVHGAAQTPPLATATGGITTQSSATSLTKQKSQTMGSKSNEEPVPSIFPKLKPIRQEQRQATPESSSNSIYTEHIHPKSIIQKFEQLVKNNAATCPSVEFVSETHTNVTTMTKSTSNGTNCSSFVNENRNSLTYVSSGISEASNFEEDEVDVDETMENNDETFKNNQSEEDAIYEELGNEEHNNSYRSTTQQEDDEEQNEMSEEENTSLFESQSSPTDTQNTNEDTYSLSSSYSGPMISKDFDNIDEEEDDEVTDIYGSYDDDTTTFEQTTDAQSTCETKSPVRKSPARPVLSSIREISDDQSSEPLFSIKEYRKQKKNTNSSGYHRRSSISANKSREVNGSSNKSVPSKPTAAQNTTDDANLKKAKYLERIKELEEFIKLEDNNIHQSGTALEKCLTDSPFTGSSEHIECNRILLISCQKRQAYSSEISRLKQLINILAKKPLQPVQPATVDEYAGLTESSNNSELSPTDLTGLLIFSDLQLPIKESYLNKLKSGDEKRIFYFLCLIRNGIQVLQTQVISVQELIATRDTAIIFTNRMAINNVDVNFKVKIDIYTLEITPKEIKHGKSNSLASNATSKFFSPFKNSVFYPHHHAAASHASANSNHHYNEGSSLGITNGGAKSSNFIHVDTIEITNKDLSTNRFKLNISSSSIPLTGVLFVTVRCMPSKSIELKGFMTLLEDVNGFRSWDRRWCFLNNYNISYWKYPEDEYRNSPLGIINLTKCVTEKVSILPRDICARKYTFELAVCESEQTSDKEPLNEDTLKCKRYRLSADTKEQANDWLTNVNYALANLKLWNPKTNKPIKK